MYIERKKKVVNHVVEEPYRCEFVDHISGFAFLLFYSV